MEIESDLEPYFELSYEKKKNTPVARMEHAGQGSSGLPRRARLASEKYEEAQKQSIHWLRKQGIFELPIYILYLLRDPYLMGDGRVILNWYRCMEHWIPDGTTPIGKTGLEDGGGLTRNQGIKFRSGLCCFPLEVEAFSRRCTGVLTCGLCSGWALEG